MAGKSKVNIFKNMTKKELDKAIHEYVSPYRTYERLYAMKLLSEGYSFDIVASKMDKSYQTIHRWAKTCESYGVEGLKPNFDGGRPGKITSDNLVKLDEIIQNKKEITIDEVHDILLNEFNADYSMKQVWVILTEKLNYKCKNKKVLIK